MSLVLRSLVLSCLSVLLISGCSYNSPLVSHKLPLISHAHIGHALTAWHGTPDEQGLFIVAEQEVQFALDETNLAILPGNSKASIQQNLANVIHALDQSKNNPSSNSSIGVSKLNYGAITALAEATDHMVYAAESDDASENMKQMVSDFSNAQKKVRTRMELAIEVAKLTQQSVGSEQQALLHELKDTLQNVLNGVDQNNDGEMAAIEEEYGLLQLRNIVSTGLNNEHPPYHPVGKKYLLGLVRLPDGNWEYRFDKTNTRKPY